MRLVFAKRPPGRIEFEIIYGTIALLVLFAGRFLPLLALAPDCAFKAITGLPCPTCGATRSIVYLSHAEFFSSLALNPLAFGIFITALLALVYGTTTLVFGLRRVGIILSRDEKDLLRIALLIMIFLNWLYLLVSL